MNSTDDKDLETMLGELFDQVLTPIAERMRADGEQAFPLRPDVSWLSYYVRRKRSAMVADDFTSASCVDADELEQRLAAHWQGLGRAELLAQVAHFGQVARVARAAQAAGTPQAEVSPYVYAMF